MVHHPYGFIGQAATAYDHVSGECLHLHASASFEAWPTTAKKPTREAATAVTGDVVCLVYGDCTKKMKSLHNL